MTLIEIDYQPLALYKILKIAGIASGGAAKQLIADGQITLNGQVEWQKRKKIMAGDVVCFGAACFKIALNPTPIHPESS